MHEPIVLSSGYVLDRASAVNANGGLKLQRCPFTRKPLKSEVYPLQLLREKVVAFKQTRLEQIFAMADKLISTSAWEEATTVIEIGWQFLSDIGRTTYHREARRAAEMELRIKPVHADAARLCGAMAKHYGALKCSTEHAETLAEFLSSGGVVSLHATAHSRLAAQLDDAAQWVDAAGSLLEMLERDDARGFLLPQAQLMLRLAKLRTAVGSELVGAQATVFKVLQLTGSAAEQQEFLAAEGIGAAMLVDPNPVMICVDGRSDRSSSNEWVELHVSPLLESQLARIEVSWRWKDQGWGNRKGALRLVLVRGAGLNEPVCHDVGGIAPHAWENVAESPFSFESVPGGDRRGLGGIQRSVGKLSARFVVMCPSDRYDRLGVHRRHAPRCS